MDGPAINQAWLEVFNVHPNLLKKIIELDYTINIIHDQKGIILQRENREKPDPELVNAYSSWLDYRKACGNQNTGKIKRTAQALGDVGSKNPFLPYPTSFFFRQYQSDPSKKKFFLLAYEGQSIPLEYFSKVINADQAQKGNFAIHAAGIVHKGKMFLFGGPSEIGKSTVTRLSSEAGDEIIDEDQLLLWNDDNQTISVQGWGYSLTKCELPLCGVFKLRQGSEAGMMRLSQMKTAHFVSTQILEVLGSQIPAEIAQRIFAFSSSLARTLPGYELQFRKSPDFWTLIDQEFDLA